MKTSTVKGTNDYLPKEVLLRDYLQNTILETYINNGFEHIITPAIEDAENLDKSEGGENLNLIFKILKRGDKLAKAIEEKNYDSLSDMGLRYDLTLPLSRYYANNRANFILPLKTIQIDRVYRAERPQKGRLREFIQCDIDIIGSTNPSCEIELIYTTAKALLAININEFRIKVNDRRLLSAVLCGIGFAKEDIESVCIVFDKLDKIGIEGVISELNEKGYDNDVTAKFERFIGDGNITLETVRSFISEEDECYVSHIERIINESKKLAKEKYDVVFDISLVRGQGYYTGTIFEVESLKFKGAIAGGGRYDNLIGKFTGESVPAVGFSIGFERIYSILSEQDYKPADYRKKVAVFYNEEEYTDACIKADELRNEYDVTMYARPKKLGKFLGKIEMQGYYGFLVYGEEGEIKLL